MSTVSGIEKLNSAFQSLITQSGSSQVLQSANLIGRSVLVPGHDLNLSKGVSTLFAVDLPNTADSVKVTVSDSSGAVVRSIDLGGLSQGVKSFSWDGKNDGGASLSDGSYSINVIALAGGSQTSANALTYANVISVSQTSTGVSLDIGHGRKAALSDVKQIL
jgi:flagellar basal-body rod modification protein FlgD